MKKGRFTEVQIDCPIKKQEARIAVKDICREQGISEATFYNLSADRQVGKPSTEVWKPVVIFPFFSAKVG